MEKFLFVFKLEDGAIIVGWLKLILSTLAFLAVMIGAVCSSMLRESMNEVLKSDPIELITEAPSSSVIKDTMKKIANKVSETVMGAKPEAEFTKPDDGASDFNIYFLLITIFFACYAALSFALIVGSVNHHHMKVLSFLIVDGLFTLMMLYAVYYSWWSVPFILGLIIQAYLLFSVFSFWQQLRKEEKIRQENQKARYRTESVPKRVEPPRPRPQVAQVLPTVLPIQVEPVDSWDDYVSKI